MSESRDRIKAPPTEQQPRSRSYIDETGMTWLVSEQRFSEYDRRSGNSLIFSSELAVRRVRSYPGDWHTMSASELEALSWRK